MKSTILLLLGFISSFACAAQLAPNEQAVWELEEAYWNFVESNDTERYLELWHADFVGWPRSSGAPSGIANIADWMVPLHTDQSRLPRHELNLEAIQAFGDEIVVVHYVASRYFLDSDSGRRLPISESYVPARLTHTWKRENGTWKIIAGMSADWTP